MGLVDFIHVGASLFLSRARSFLPLAFRFRVSENVCESFRRSSRDLRMLGSLLSEATGFAPYPVMVSPQKRPLEDDTRTDAAGVGLRPRSQRRVVPEELMASQRRGGAGHCL